ncbi:MAG: hypothetical protein IJG41_01935 [Bacteroidales bacterium]|nr:hypothetical protein [Bacteroidales bacterium]
MKKNIWIVTLSVLAISIVLAFFVGCNKEKKEPPQAPTGLRVDVSDGYVTYTWNPVEDADYYHAEYYMGSGPVYGTSYTLGHYFFGEVDLTFRVAAVNESGTSAYSSIFYHYSPNNGGGGNGGGGNGSTTISAPTGVSACVSGSQVRVSWNSVSNASYYIIYRASSSSGSYSMLERAYGTYYYDSSPNTDNYYKVTAVSNSGDESNKSDYAYCYYSSGGGGGGGGTTVPEAPTGINAVNVGNAMLPDIKISWNSVSNATSYKVYRSTSASGSYSQIGSETTNTFLYDSNPRQGYNYYKVKAFNSAGGSSYSSYAVFNYDPGSQLSPCPVHYTGHTATSTTITLRWSNPTTSGCGTPTKATLRVRHPDIGDYIDLETLSGSATSVSFAYRLYVHNDGYVYCGIVTENAAGSSGGLPMVYNVNTGTWYGGNGKQYTEEMEMEELNFSNMNQ